ncbi:hypothetical protein [Pseudoclavibacter sp. VKM Ac-2888]|uniref:hypothetical protein n=1 Tax=Pseudoclavibacter sp. VKM Ac-2888 TaxID=2783830 RepID=UPI00188CEDC4|nr:hypothetical protein [Pseudoclavibacter sp. VKM Ac-2888]MBF4549477.1 hypothetical protein [Pseudoclavibacter sp. VKM Ac-2888]
MDSLRIEGVGSSDYQVGRAWSPDGTYESLPTPESMYVLLTIEGDGVVAHDDRVVPYAENHIVFLDGELPTDITLANSTARYLWRFDSTVLRVPKVRERVGELIPVGQRIWGPAAALTNGLIGADPRLSASMHAGRASEYLLSAIFDNLAPSTASRRGPKWVYRDAMAVIELNKDDPGFTSGHIPREVGVHDRTVRRAFTLMGTTARRELERQRVQTLQSRMGSRHLTSRQFAHHAEASGFATVRQARVALQRNLQA